MGLFDKFIDKASNVVRKVFSQETIGNVVRNTNIILSTITNPIKTLVDPERSIKETERKSAGRLVAEGVTNTLIALSPFTPVGQAVLPAVGTALIPKTPLGVLATGAGTIVGAGALSKSPTLTYDILDIPNKLFGGGEKLGEIYPSIPPFDAPTKEETPDKNYWENKLITYIKENPYISLATILAIFGTLLNYKTILNLYNLYSLNKIKEDVKDLTTTPKTEIPTSNPLTTNPITIINQIPSTETLTTPKKRAITKKKAKKKAKKRTVKKKAKKKSIKRRKK